MWIDRILRLVYPHRCLSCGKVVRGRAAFCMDCAPHVPLLTDSKRLCKICSRPIGEGHFLCRDCLVRPRHFVCCFAAALYKGRLRRAIIRFKFRNQPHLYHGFSHLMLMCLAERKILPRFDFVIPAPLSKNRLAERGYNQAELLAGPVARGLKVPLATDVIYKTRETPPQSSLPYHKRLKNLKNAFRVPDKSRVQGKRILLIDDVLTSGATADEISKTLLRAGAKEVYVAVATVTQIDKQLGM